MAKFVALWHAGADPAEFEQRYRQGHVPLAEALPDSFVETSRVIGDGPWMWMTEIRFPSVDAARAALSSPAGDAARVDAHAMADALGLQFDTFLAEDVTELETGGGEEEHRAPVLRSVAPDGGDGYWFGDARMTIKARASLSGTTIIEMVLPAGATAPLHVHENLDDTFVILEGQLAVWCDGETLTLHPGAYAQLPRGVPHSILADGATVRALLIHDSDEMAEFIEAAGIRRGDEVDAPRFSGDAVAHAAREHGQRVIGPAPFAATA
jgi:uncharacterized protein (TIGR02118 family)